MTTKKGILKCNICGNIVEVLDTGAGSIVCCGEIMNELSENTTKNEGMEKHVPIIKETDNGYEVLVGSTPHPMEDGHYIEWIELNVGSKSYKKFLKPGMEPKIKFCVEKDTSVFARAYCNVHSLWRS